MGKGQKNELISETVGPQEAAGLEGTVAEIAGTSMEEKLASAEDELAGLRDKMLRTAAEFDNYRKRMERDRLSSLKYASESVLREILPVVDNLERALSQGALVGVDAQKNMASLLEGVQLTLKSLLAALEKFEVRPLNSIGKAFDPTIHEALAMEASDEVPASHVLSEFEKGYFYKDRLLRVAKVIVSSGKAAA